ncbi:MAG: hypothetical protein ACJ77A_14745 [Actinomycetota bacterium]
MTGTRHRPSRRQWLPLAIVAAVAVVVLAARLVGGGLGARSRDPAEGTPSRTGGGSGSSPGATASSGAPERPRLPYPIPGFLLIADRGNDRMLLVDSHKGILWQYPRPGIAPTVPFHFDDDTFFTPGWHDIISNQEDQQTVQVISFPGRRVQWTYGHVDVPGVAQAFLHTPDDAYMLPNGVRTVADVHNCRVLFISRSGHVVKQYGTTGVCRHDPPRFLASPNGDTPLRGGGTIVTEINGSWIDGIGADGKLMWSVHAPVGYPSDAQWLGNGKLLVADYSSPGHVLIMTTKGRVLFRYGPDSGPGELNHPSLALMLPNHLIAVNDDLRNRVVLIDPRRHKIVWRYGRTDVAGRAPGLLDTPDGMDFLPFDVAMRIPGVRAIVRHGVGP